MTSPNTPADVASLPAILHELDILLAAQGKLQFAREDYDEAAATVFGVALLDFLRVHGMEIRRRLATTEQPGSSVQGEAVATKDCDLVRELRALTPYLCARDRIVLEDAARRIESIITPACPECAAVLLYECPACSANNYPTTTPPPAPAAEQGGLAVENAPIGTRAPAIGGGHWYRVKHGWMWNGPTGSGSTFNRPGGDWNGKLISPTTQPEARGVEGMVVAYKCPTCGAPASKTEREGVYDMHDVYTYAPSAPNPVRAEQPEGKGASFADGVKACIAWVVQRRHNFEEEYGSIDPTTNAMEFGSVEREEYDRELVEIEEGLRKLLAAAPEPVRVDGRMTPYMAKQWLDELMGDHDFTLPTDAYTNLVAALAGKDGA